MSPTNMCYTMDNLKEDKFVMSWPIIWTIRQTHQDPMSWFEVRFFKERWQKCSEQHHQHFWCLNTINNIFKERSWTTLSRKEVWIKKWCLSESLLQNIHELNRFLKCFIDLTLACLCVQTPLVILSVFRENITSNPPQGIRRKKWKKKS